jgi:hypothetical protein
LKRRRGVYNDIENRRPERFDEVPDFAKPLRCIDNRGQFERLADWSRSTYQNYKLQLYPQDKSKSYSDPNHAKQGLSGDERLFRIRRDLMGFENPPIELQMKMHEAAFSVEGPMIYREELIAIATNLLTESTDGLPTRS